jgi:hypothetical protein
VIFKGQKLNLTEETTFDALHNKLTSIVGSNVSQQLPSSLMESLQQSTASSSKDSMLTPRINQIVWEPWWKQQIALCDKMIEYAIKGEFE